MTTDALDELWNSAPNRPSADTGARLATHFVTRLRRRRRFQGWWLAWTFLALAATMVFALTQLVKHGPAVLAGQWAIWPLLGLPWAAAFFFLRRFYQEGAASKSTPTALRDALVAARVAHRAERRRLVSVAILLSAMLPVTVVALWQLQVAGKTNGAEAWSMGFVFGLAFMLGAGLVTWRYRRVVRELGKIESLMRDLESNPAV